MKAARVIHFAVILGLVSAAAAAEETIPREIRKRFPEERFIIRSGTGETPEAAAESARFEIAKFFEARISGETLVRQWARSRTTRGKTVEDHLTELSNTVIVGASRNIPGIDIVKTDLDKKKKTYTAWAVLDKNNYRSVLAERIGNVDRDVSDKLSRRADSDITALRTLTDVMRSLVERRRYRMDLLLLDPGAAVEPKDVLLNSVMTSIDSLVTEAFDVGIVFLGEVKNDVKSGIVGGIVDAGIRLKEYSDVSECAGAGADLVMIVEHTVSPKTASFRNRVFHNMDWVLSVKAADPSTGKVIDALVLNGKIAGAQNESQAEDRMVKKILTSHVPRISSWVYELIFSPGE